MKAVLRDYDKVSGYELLRNRFTNKSTAFTAEERERLGLEGRLPAVVETMEEQVVRTKAQLLQYSEPLHQYSFLRGVQESNTTLFYRLVMENLELVLPLIYTPTVGAACQHFSNLYRDEHGVYITPRDSGRIRQLLCNCCRTELDVIVITDGSRILGLGDLGANGMGIPIGKCALYVAGAGLDPKRVLPITLDVGTNNDQFLSDPRYMGLRRARGDDAEFYGLLDEVMREVFRLYPEVVLQFEDFSNNHCFDVLERYRNKYRCFNDDIQGTGAVIAAGFLNAVRVSKVPALEHRIVVFGAGSAAVGVVDAICHAVSAKFGTSVAEMRSRVWLVDTKGLVTNTRGDALAPHKVAWARTDVAKEDNAKYATLKGVCQMVKPTALIGLAASGPAFTKDVVEIVMESAERPIIFPLSNPTSKSEITAFDAFTWTKGRAIVASGSPFPPVTVDGQVKRAAQGNNMYIFPGVGLGCSLAQVRSITEELMTAAAIALAEMVENPEETGLYPPLSEIRSASAVVAAAVIAQSVNDGLCTKAGFATATLEELRAAAAAAMWEPVYCPPEWYYAHHDDTTLPRAPKSILTHSASRDALAGGTSVTPPRVA